METLLARLRRVDADSLHRAGWLVAELEREQTAVAPSGPVLVGDVAPVMGWRERLWVCPAETRLGLAELCEATGKPKSWAYRGTSAGTLPHRKFDGALCFTAGEIRAYLRDHEESVVEGRMESGPAERGWLRAG